LEGEYIPDNEAIVKDVVDQFQKIQAHMKNDYLSLKAVLTSLGVNLTDIDRIKE